MQIDKGQSIALLGRNGSGKSTLLQIIATYMLPAKGEVIYRENNQTLDAEEIFRSVSYCAPYLELIEELTLKEFLEYHFTFKKSLLPIPDMIDYLGLQAAANKPIEKFSSGMKQRVKLAQAVFADTPVLLLDEPCTNLDEMGITQYHDMISTFGKNRILVVASNDEKEFKVCETKIDISKS
ncbi:MAG: hypothetical protein RIQ62_434 [Bacteroidota bacterium]|jgi:ABC-type multidrug transport system ATPase subunit